MGKTLRNKKQTNDWEQTDYGRPAKIARRIAAKQNKMANPQSKSNKDCLQHVIEKEKSRLEEMLKLKAPCPSEPTSSVVDPRSIEADKRRCFHFGMDRRQIYGLLFDWCTNCENYDSMPPDKKKSCKLDSKSYRCKAKFLPTNDDIEQAINSKEGMVGTLLMNSQPRAKSKYCELSSNEESTLSQSTSPDSSDSSIPFFPLKAVNMKVGLTTRRVTCHVNLWSSDLEVESELTEPTPTKHDGVAQTEPVQVLSTKPSPSKEDREAQTESCTKRKASQTTEEMIRKADIKKSSPYKKIQEDLRNEKESRRKQKERSVNCKEESISQWKKRIFCELNSLIESVSDKEKQEKLVDSIATDIFDKKKGPCIKVAIRLANKSLEYSREEIRRDIFPAWKVLQAMDLNGGGLCYNGVNIIRNVEANDIRWMRCLLPSASSLRSVAEEAEIFMKDRMPYKHFQLEEKFGGGEGISFDPKDVTPLALEVFGLLEISKDRSVSVALSQDGALLDNRTTHVTQGIKVCSGLLLSTAATSLPTAVLHHVMLPYTQINDKAAICPITKLNRVTGNLNKDFLAQSSNVCFPIKFLLAKETNELSEMFVEECHLFTEEILKNEKDLSLLVPGAKPLTVSFEVDMSARWKGRGKGCGRGPGRKPCDICSQDGEHMATPNPEQCDVCRKILANRDEETRRKHVCYHQKFLSREVISELKVDAKNAEKALGIVSAELENLRNKSMINADRDPRKAEGNLRNNPRSVWYNYKIPKKHSYEPDVLGQKQRNRVTFSKWLNEDLALRSLSTKGNLTVRVQRLRERLVQEYAARKLQEDIVHGELNDDTALFLLINTIPCVLHMENRIGLKILTTLLWRGVELLQSGDLYPDFEQSDKARLHKYVSDIEKAINRAVLGTPKTPAQWVCPMDTKREEIGILRFDNNRTRKSINQLKELLDVCLCDEEEKQVWIECIEHYRVSMELLRKKQDLTDQEINEYQFQADLFFQKWISITGGVAGVSNYIHLMGAGHMHNYLEHWRNLYRHSQQGWEAFNGMIKTFYYRRTNRGGGKNGSSKLEPIARWFQRRMLWMLGIPYEEIKQYADTKRGKKKKSNILPPSNRYTVEAVHERDIEFEDAVKVVEQLTKTADCFFADSDDDDLLKGGLETCAKK